MSEDKENSNQVKDIIRTVLEGDETVFDFKESDAGTPAKLNITRQRLPELAAPETEKARSPRRTHRFSTLDGFTNYINKFKTANSVVFANAGEIEAECVIDELAADGFEIVLYSPMFHPRFDAWNAWLNKYKDVLEFSDFVMQNRTDVTAIDGKSDKSAGRTLALIFSQLTTSNQVTINAGKGVDALNGIIVQTKIGGGKVQDEVMDLPEQITITVPPFLLDEDIDLPIDISIKAKSQKSDETGVLIMLTCSELKTQVAQKFIEEITSIEIKGVTVTFGQTNHRDWDTVE